MCSTYIDYLKYRYQSKSEKWTPLISGHIFFFHQRCPPISIYSSLISCGTHVSAWHIYVASWEWVLFLLPYFLLKMLSVMNDLHCHKKSRHILDKNSQLTIIWYNYKVSNLQKKLYTSANVLRNCWSSQKVFLKISCFSVGSAEFLRISFFWSSWASASDFIFDIFESNK